MAAMAFRSYQLHNIEQTVTISSLMALYGLHQCSLDDLDKHLNSTIPPGLWRGGGGVCVGAGGSFIRSRGSV